MNRKVRERVLVSVNSRLRILASLGMGNIYIYTHKRIFSDVYNKLFESCLRGIFDPAPIFLFFFGISSSGFTFGKKQIHLNKS